MNDVSSRGAVLQEVALDAAREWTAGCLLGLEREGRPIAGGWPGTVQEARMRGRNLAARVFSKRSLVAPTDAELEEVARKTYDEARRIWRGHVRPSASDE